MKWDQYFLLQFEVQYLLEFLLKSEEKSNFRRESEKSDTVPENWNFLVLNLQVAGEDGLLYFGYCQKRVGEEKLDPLFENFSRNLQEQ